MYPIIFEPIYKEMIWGGNSLEKLLGRTTPFKRTGESWDITCRPNEMGIVSNGEYKGKLFEELIDMNHEAILGRTLCAKKHFPLLIKLISAEGDLSVQVHPDDKYAEKAENSMTGKAEAWYVLEAPKDSRLIIGIKSGVTKEIFKDSLEKGTVEDILEYLSVKRGDVINIPAGLVHALTKGSVVVEVQQNSDITYRAYDYNRLGLDGKPRHLNITKALDVIDFDGRIKKGITEGYAVQIGGNKFIYYISNIYFTVIKYEIENSHSESSDKDKFYTFICVDGSCTFESENYKLRVKAGDTVFIPAFLGDYNIKGKCALLKCFVGDTENDFVKPLIEQGYKREDIVLE